MTQQQLRHKGKTPRSLSSYEKLLQEHHALKAEKESLKEQLAGAQDQNGGAGAAGWAGS